MHRRVVVEQRQEHHHAFDNRRPEARIQLAPAVHVPALDGLELQLARGPRRALRLLHHVGDVARRQEGFEVGLVRVRHVVVVLDVPVPPRHLRAVRLMVGLSNAQDGGRIRQFRLQSTDVAVDLPVLQHVAVHLRERRVAVGDAPQQDHELQQVGVGLLPERFLRLAEQVVQQRGDGVGHGVRVEVVVQRVVADAGVEPDLDVVRLASRALQHGAHLAAEVALHFQDEAADLAVGISAAPAQQLVHVGIHARGRLAGAHGAQHHDAGVEPALGDREPLRRRRTARCGFEVRLAQHQCGRRTRLRLRVRWQCRELRAGHTSIHDDRHQRHDQRRGQERRAEPQRGVAVAQQREHAGRAHIDQAEERVVGDKRVRGQAPHAHRAGHGEGDDASGVHECAKHGVSRW